MQCGFKGGVEQMNCSMSHCHDRGHTLMASVQFVLPIPPAPLGPQRVAQLSAALECVQVFHTFDPPTLPPRNPQL